MKRQARRMMGIFAAVAAVGSQGCGTLHVRGARSQEPDCIYPAVRKDCQTIAACFSGGTGFHERGGIAKILGYTVVPLCWIFDTPVSALSDTVCLSKDWRRVKKEKPEPEGAAQPER